MQTKYRLRNYLLWGRIFTNIGDSVLYMLVVWHFNERYSSPIFLSLAFATMSIVDAFSFLEGPFIDNTTPKQNLFLISLLQSVCICILFFLTFTVDKKSPGYSVILLIVLLLIYVGSSIIYPSGEKLIPKIVNYDELLYTNGLFAISEKTLDIAFNALSAIIISFFCHNHIIFCVLSVFCVATKFYHLVSNYFSTSIKPKERIPKDYYSVKAYIFDLKNGFKEIKHHANILEMFLPLSVINVFYGVAMVGLPKVSEIYICDQAYGYGSLLMCASIGGILGGGLIKNFVKGVENPRKYIKAFLLIAGIAWFFIPITIRYTFIFSYVLILISNCAINMMNVMFVTIIQKEVNTSLLGRVSTTTESIVSISIPIGNFWGGFILSYSTPLMTQVLYCWSPGESTTQSPIETANLSSTEIANAPWLINHQQLFSRITDFY